MESRKKREKKKEKRKRKRKKEMGSYFTLFFLYAMMMWKEQLLDALFK